MAGLATLSVLVRLLAFGWALTLLWRKRLDAQTIAVVSVATLGLWLPASYGYSLANGLPVERLVSSAPGGVFGVVEGAAVVVLMMVAVRSFGTQLLTIDSLQGYREQYQTLVDTIPHGIFEINARGYITFSNAAANRIFGYEEEGLVSRSIWEFARTDYERSALCDYIARLLQEQTASTQHFLSGVRRNGTTVELQMDWNYNRRPDGTLDGLVSVVTDVTKRKRSEEVLRLIVDGASSSTGEDFFRSLVQHLALALRVRHAFVAEFTDAIQTRCRTISIWNGDSFGPTREFEIVDTPASRVVEEKLVIVDEGASKLYPDDDWIQEKGIDAYIAISLFDLSGEPLGFMGVMHEAPFESDFVAESILRIFAARAGAELERKRAEELVRTSESRLRTVVQGMPVMMIAFDEQSNVLAWNKECKHVTGYSTDEMVGNDQALQLLGPDGYLPARRHETQDPTDSVLRSWEWTITTRKGERRVVEWTDNSERIPIHGWRYWGTGVDITERKRAESELRRSESANRAILDSIPDLKLRINRQGVCVDFKPAKTGESLFESEPTGRPLDSLLLPDVAALFLETVENVLKDSRTRTFEFRQLEGEEERSYETRVVSMGKGEALAIVRDMTERVRLENEILEISGREQRRIGQDFHDGVGQLLTGIAFMTRALHQRLEAKPGLEDASVSAAEIVQLVQDAISKTRRLARGLCPVHLEQNGLAAALNELAADTENIYDIRCDCCCELEGAVTDNMAATHLYRIAQEAVTNAVKHGNARHVEVQLHADDETGALTVSDDGSGIPEDADRSNGMGLSIMGYRANMIGAKLEIRKRETGGTLVSCRFPRLTSTKSENR